ncbi:MAG: cytidine deaminase [Phascolarctobacterium sp.]|nr:cytidine deaminase [Phascolarctobacterium sp.]
MLDTHVDKLAPELQELYAAAVEARKNSYSPYSHFAVGAAVRTADGKIYGGCNVENASYGLCLCGERNAIFSAVAAGERELEAICVVADTTGPVSPCGACRQVMSEFKLKRILLANLVGAIKLCTLEELLPYGFEL